MSIKSFQVIPLDAPALDVQAFTSEANGFQEFLRFTPMPLSRGSILLVTEKPQDYFVEMVGPFLKLSLRNGRGISGYAQISLVEYSLIGVYIGMLIARVLKDGPHFFREDFFHESSPPCVLSHVGRLETFGQMVSGLYLCPSCRRFFPSVGAEREFKALAEMLDVVESARISRSCRRRRAGSVKEL